MNISTELARLERAGLIRPGQPEPDWEYLFRHVLSQEAAYGSLVKADRRRLHLAVGECLERDFAANAAELAPILGMHFEQAGADERALKYLVQAAEGAARRYANAEAIKFYDRALDIARRSDADDRSLVDLALKRGRLLEITGDYRGALASYDELRALAVQRGDRALALQAELARATVFAAPTELFNGALGEQSVDAALALARELGDRPAEARALWLDLLLRKFIQDIPRGIASGERAITIARELGLKELLAFVLNDIFAMYLINGRHEKGLESVAEAVQLFREVGNHNLLIDAQTNYGEFQVFGGEVEVGFRAVLEARELADAIGNLWGQAYSNNVIGIALAERGWVSDAIESFTKGMVYAEQAGFAIGQTLPRAQLAFCLSGLGAHDRAMAIAQDGLDVATRLIPSWRGQPMGALALCTIRSGDAAAARQAVERFREIASPYDLSMIYLGMCEAELFLLIRDYAAALELTAAGERALKPYGLRIYLVDLVVYRGLAFMGLGQFDRAAEALGEAASMAERFGSRRVLWRALCALFECETRLGRASAPETRRRALAEIEFLATNIAEDDLRQIFLAQADVRRVLGAST